VLSTILFRSAASGAAQSRQRYGGSSEGLKSAPTARAFVASTSSVSSRMRRKRIHVSSGTYCRAPAQFERRRMSHTLQMALSSPERVVDLVFGLAGLGMSGGGSDKIKIEKN